MKKITLLYLLLLKLSVYSQAIQVDNTFNEGNTGPKYLSSVNRTTVLPDGKILITGGFSEYNNVVKKRVARLYADGTLDETFDPGTGPGAQSDGYSGYVQTHVVYPNGKILIAGNFTSFDNVSRKYIVRLNEDGSVDNSFNANSVFVSNAVQNFSITNIILTPEGKIFVGGNFLAQNNNLYNYNYVRLNSDGSFDTSYSYNNLLDENDDITEVALQPNGKIVLGFTGFFGSSILRLNSDGSPDIDFNSNSNIHGTVTSLYATPDNKILVGGLFSNPSEAILFRLTQEGFIDNSFQISHHQSYGQTTAVYAIMPYGDQYIIGGRFILNENNLISDFGVISHDGLPDNNLYLSQALGHDLYNDSIYSIGINDDGSIIVAGNFINVSNTPKPGLAKLNGLPLNNVSFNNQNSTICYSKDLFINLKSTKTIKQVTMYDISGKSLNNFSGLNSSEFSFMKEKRNDIVILQVQLLDNTTEFFKILL